MISSIRGDWRATMSRPAGKHPAPSDKPAAEGQADALKGRGLAIASRGASRRGLADGDDQPIATHPPPTAFKAAGAGHRPKPSSTRRTACFIGQPRTDCKRKPMWQWRLFDSPGPCAPPAGSGGSRLGAQRKEPPRSPPCGQARGCWEVESMLASRLPPRGWGSCSSPAWPHSGALRSGSAACVSVPVVGPIPRTCRCSSSRPIAVWREHPQPERCAEHVLAGVLCGGIHPARCWPACGRRGGARAPSETRPPSPPRAGPAPTPASLGELLPTPGGVGLGIFEGHMHTGWLSRPLTRAGGAFRMAPMSSGAIDPTSGRIALVTDPGGGTNTIGGSGQQGCVGARDSQRDQAGRSARVRGPWPSRNFLELGVVTGAAVDPEPLPRSPRWAGAPRGSDRQTH